MPNAYNAVKLDEPFLVKGDKGNQSRGYVCTITMNGGGHARIAAVGDDYIPGKV